MIENAVYAATQASIIKQLHSMDDISVYLLSADIEARGLSPMINIQATIVDDQQFVALSCQHDKVVSWF